MKIELEKTGRINGRSVAIELTYEHDGYSAAHFVDGEEVNRVDAARCYATVAPQSRKEPEEEARQALEQEWNNRIDDMAEGLSV